MYLLFGDICKAANHGYETKLTEFFLNSFSHAILQLNLTYLIFAVNIPRTIQKFRVLVLGSEMPNAQSKLLDKFFFATVDNWLTCEP